MFPDPIPFSKVGRGGAISLGGGVTVQARSFLVIAVGVGLAAAASIVLERTGRGKALQAIGNDLEAARVVGLPVDRLLASAFAGIGAVAALIAVVAAPSGPVSADTGALEGLKGLAAALVAGFGSPWRSFAAGIGLGVLEAGVTSLHVGGVGLGPAWRDVVPLGLAMSLTVLARRRSGAPTE